MLLTFDTVEFNYHASYHLKAFDKVLFKYIHIYIDWKKSFFPIVLWSYHVTYILATHLIKC